MQGFLVTRDQLIEEATKAKQDGLEPLHCKMKKEEKGEYAHFIERLPIFHTISRNKCAFSLIKAKQICMASTYSHFGYCNIPFKTTSFQSTVYFPFNSLVRKDLMPWCDI